MESAENRTGQVTKQSTIANTTMKRKILSLALSAVLILLSVPFLNNEKVVEAADDLVLLENRHPGYWNYLRPEVGYDFVASKNNAKNLIVSDMHDQSLNGVNLTVNSDKSLTLAGTNNSGDWFNFSMGEVCIPNGEYQLSIGADNNSGATLYVWSNKLRKVVGNSLEATVSIDNNISTYSVGISIAPDAHFENLTLYPMIQKEEDQAYSPYIDTDESCRVRIFYIDKLDDLTDEDLKILMTYMKNQYRKYGWVSIVDKESTCIQWIDGRQLHGKADFLGRVTD